MRLSTSQKIIISTDVLNQEVSGETVLLDLKSETYFGLDATGTRIWQLIREKGDVQSVFDTMLVEFDVDEAQLRKDFSALLAQLSEAGLVSMDSSP